MWVIYAYIFHLNLLKFNHLIMCHYLISCFRIIKMRLLESSFVVLNVLANETGLRQHLWDSCEAYDVPRYLRPWTRTLFWEKQYYWNVTPFKGPPSGGPRNQRLALRYFFVLALFIFYGKKDNSQPTTGWHVAPTVLLNVRFLSFPTVPCLKYLSRNDLVFWSP